MCVCVCILHNGLFIIIFIIIIIIPVIIIIFIVFLIFLLLSLTFPLEIVYFCSAIVGE